MQAFIPEVLAEDSDLDAYIRNLRGLLLTRPVIAATATTWLSGTWHEFLRFDVAIVDEASQLTVPMTLGALALATRFILIGDHKQLPPVVLSESNKRIRDVDGDERPRLSKSLFESLFVQAEDKYPEALVKLNEQYRMNEKICAIPRALWYDDDLRPGSEKVAIAKLSLLHQAEPPQRLATVLDPEREVVFVHVPWQGGSDAPRSSRREAEFVRDIIVAYRALGLTLPAMGVIAPYKAQVSTIRRTLEAALPKEAAEVGKLVDTVDRFQGQEREVIVISLATYGDFVHELLQDERRLNVAVTRAKYKLIILGDRSVLAAHPTFYGLIKHCHQVTVEAAPGKS